jgi:uncharacterized membrane protein
VSTTSSQRLAYLDWLRGLTVLIMIEAHTFDAWTLPAERARPGFGRLMLLAGMAAPLFLFLAGVAVSLAGASHLRRSRTTRVASKLVQRRGWQVLFYAFLLRLQSFVLGGLTAPANLLKVDILNVMGPAIAGTAAIWGMATSRRAKAVWLAVATLVLLAITPAVRESQFVGSLPEPIASYFRPPPGKGTFTFLPWAGFVLAGGVLGVVIEGASPWWRPGRLQAAIALAGVALIVLGDWAAYRPALFPDAHFWTTSPAFFAIRAGIILLMVAASSVWSRRPWRRSDRPGPLERFGMGSLFVYWVHVELVYGVMTRPLRRQLTLEQCALAWALFSLAMYCLLMAWNVSRPTRLRIRDSLLRAFKSETWLPVTLARR